MATVEPKHYARRVYAGVLGKVIGVYAGKPFEGRTNAAIEKLLGEVWYYVHDQMNYPLVCADDDISGTFTFLRAIEDHHAGRGITSKQVGQTWLNYLIENQTVLWWGGMGISTEHTAWLRLASGVPAPASGSMALNGRTVAEQIGAQIFIDGFGLVAPGDPELAARLAGEAARVSHDGEAVYAAQAVAAMEAAAFEESDMQRLLDVALSVMPEDCLIAQVHRDVRRWAGESGEDWRATLRRIEDRYGYDKYGGGCHMVPNHALMVMAWAHAPNDFQKALMITNTAGWDTDCNAGNVGCLMGIKLGLEGIHAGPDWQGPFADRVVIPTAEGTHGISDVLLQADLVTRIGRQVMGWDARPAPKNGARFHFTQPSARHGFMPERIVTTGDRIRITAPGDKLVVRFEGLAPGVPARISTPTFLLPEQLNQTGGGYAAIATPALYSGQTVSAELRAMEGEGLSARLFVRYYQPSEAPHPAPRWALDGMAASEPVALAPGHANVLHWTVPSTDGWPIAQIGVQIDGPAGTDGGVELRWMDWSGRAQVDFSAGPMGRGGVDTFFGWILNCSSAFRADWGPQVYLIHNRGVGLAHTGSAGWIDYSVSAKVAVRLADRAGIAARYGGLHRHVALVYNRVEKQLQLARQYDEQRQVLDSIPCQWALEEAHDLRLDVQGDRVTGYADGKQVLGGVISDGLGQPVLAAGGVALLSDNGTTSFQQVRVA